MSLLDWYDTLHMDYNGQARAEKLSRIIILLFGFVGFVCGYVLQRFFETVAMLGVGFFFAAILTIPPWPIYRKKSLNWQKVRPEWSNDSEVTESKEKKKKK